MIAIKVPPLGESIVEATISRWVKNEGDAVSAGDTLVELETDKITVEVPALASGVLTRRLKGRGRRGRRGRAARRDRRDGDGRRAGGRARGGRARGGRCAGRGCAGCGRAERRVGRREVLAGGAARGDERGVDLAGVTGTGRGGVVSKPDVIAASAAAPAAAPAPAPRRGGLPAPAAAPKAPAPRPRVAAPSAPAGARETRER
jgi:2-oxoglutarate dehydrogenase E2 component (dihydrolipoamide succinyltransferase)